jgi:AcrR family transcriptional regulator
MLAANREGSVAKKAGRKRRPQSRAGSSQSREAAAKRAKATAGEGARAKAAARGDPVAAMLELAALQGWRRTSLRDIAEHTRVTLGELHSRYPSKFSLLAAFSARVDDAMLTGQTADERDQPPRDRLFAAIMRRLDFLNRYKASIRSIARDLAFQPAHVLCWGLGPWRRSLIWLLESAGLDSTGLGGIVRRKGLGLIYADTFRVWLGDDSADMAKTMAALDRRLEQAAGILRRLRAFRPTAKTA